MTADWSVELFVAEGDDGVEAGGSEGGDEARDDADQREDDEGRDHRCGGGAEDDVAFVIGGLVDVGVERHRRDEVAEDDGDDHADGAGHEGEDQAFKKELREDVAAARAEGFEDADLAGALGDGDEHDVHDADAADGEGHGADDAEQDLKADGEGHDLLRVLDGVPHTEGLFIGGVEVVTLREHGADGGDGAEMELWRRWLEDDGTGVALLLERAHGFEGDEDVFVV